MHVIYIITLISQRDSAAFSVLFNLCVTFVPIDFNEP